MDLSIFESKPASVKSHAFRNRIRGLGVNNAPFVTLIEIDGVKKTHPSFICWRNMISRCTEDILWSRPTYSGVAVCEEWQSYYAFHKWWRVNHVDGWHLDKDLLTDSRLYAPDTCVFVPHWLNCFLNSHGRSRGALPVGVTYQKSNNRYRAQCSNPLDGSRGYIGLFDSPETAYNAWLEVKLGFAALLRPKMDEIDTRIFSRVVCLIKNMK